MTASREPQYPRDHTAPPAGLILLPTPAGTHAAIESDAIRALMGYLDVAAMYEDDTQTGGRL